MTSKQKRTTGPAKEARDPPVQRAPLQNGTMIEADLTLHGMHCDSCAKVVERFVLNHEGMAIREFDTANNHIVLACETRETLELVRDGLRRKGYQTLLPGEMPEEGYGAGSLKRGIGFVADVFRNAPGFEAEHTLVGYSVLAVGLLFLVQIGLYLAVFNRIPGYFATYWSVTLLTAVSVAVLLFGCFHAAAFRKTTSCMCGMMSGMTFGMAAGFLLGAFAGATNGMFVGSLVGMAAGIGFGYFTGRSCGVMGVMEGMMGGVMAGTMGAMLSVMMIFDNLVPFLFILTGVEAVIMAAFSYLLWKEYGNMTMDDVRIGEIEFAVIAIAIDLVLTVIAVFGPKAGTVLGM